MPDLRHLPFAAIALALAAPAAATQGPWHFYFAHGSDRLVAHSRQSLADFAAQARRVPVRQSILVSGFVDPSEAAAGGGRRLACRRARAIVSRLTSGALPRGRFLLYAGEDPPPETPAARDPVRRRVEFAFHADPAAARAAATGRPC